LPTIDAPEPDEADNSASFDFAFAHHDYIAEDIAEDNAEDNAAEDLDAVDELDLMFDGVTMADSTEAFTETQGSV
jgi:hypothetical protein